MAAQTEATLKYGTSGIADLLRDLDKVQAALKEVERGVKSSNEAGTPGGAGGPAKVTAYGAALKSVGAIAASAAVPVAAFWGAITAGASAAVTYAIREAAVLEQQIDKVAAVLQNGQSVRGLLEQAAVAAGAKSAYSARQAGEALEYLAMAGFNASQATTALPGVLSLAAAGSLDLARAADIASNVLTGYGKNASELAAVNDVLVATFTRSNVNLEQLGEAFKYVAPIAKASGQEFELMNAAIGRLGDAGIQGSQAGTTLRMALIRLQDPPKRARQALQELGVETKDQAGNLLQLDQILSQIAGKGANVGQIARIFGVESSAGIAALIGQGPERLREFAEQLKRVQGLAAQIERAKLDNLNGQLEITKGGAETLAASLGQVLLPELTETVKVTNDYLQSGKALVGVKAELTRSAAEQQGSLSSLARTGLAVADASANGLASALSAVLYVTVELLSPWETLKRVTGLGSATIQTAGEQAEGAAKKLGTLFLALAGGLMIFPPLGAAVGALGLGLRSVADEAGKTADAIQEATDKRRIEEAQASWTVLKDTGLVVWSSLEGAVRAYSTTARDALAGQGMSFLASIVGKLADVGKTQGQITAEAADRAAKELEANDALNERLRMGRFDLALAQARTPLERERISYERERYKLAGQLADGTIKVVEYEQQLAIAKAGYSKAAQAAAESSAKERRELERRVELAGLDLALVSATDDRERARLTATRARAAIERDLIDKKILDVEADARRAAVDAEERKALADSVAKRREEVETVAKRVELARFDLGIAQQLDERERARLTAARALAELAQGPTGGVADEEERAAKRAQIERTLREQLAELDREQAEERKKTLDQALEEATKSGDVVRQALSSITADDPWTRQLKGLGELSGGVLTLTGQLQALAEAESGAGEAFTVAMRTAGPAVSAALAQMGASQRVLSGVKAAFYAAEAVGLAATGNFPGAISAGIAAALHAAVAAGSSGSGGGGAGAVGGGGGGRAGGAAPEGSFAAPAIESTQRQLARFIGEELSTSRAGGDVNINIDMSGSTTLENSPEIKRRLTVAMRDGFAMEGLDLDRLFRPSD